MRKTVLLLASATVLAVALLVGAISERPASAAFPGKNGKIAFVSTRDGNEEIYVMDADGANETRLTTELGRDIHPMVSPDGKRITFTRRPIVGGVSEETIYVMDPEDADPQDGNGDNLIKLTPAPSPNFQSAFSPDGSRIAFVRLEDGDNEIWVMNADGTNAVQITHNTANDSRPVFSPDGTRIAFNRRDPDSPDLSLRRLDVFVMNADGTGEARLTNTTANESNPSFSPDGAKIAFDRALPPGNADIFVMNPDGTGQTRLTFDPSTDEFPAFSPDGEKLAFSSDRDGNLEIYVTSADGTAAPVRLTETETDPPAEDPAENTRLDWGPILYDFDGFHRPVDNLPATNRVNAGRAIPVKFGLGGDQGLDILAPDYPRSQQIDCASSAPPGPLEQTKSTEDGGLFYDAAADQYSYVWKTEKSWSGTCRQFVLKLDDFTIHRANFTFK